MLNLEVYDTKTLHRFKSLLVQYKRHGMITIKELMENIDEHLMENAPIVKIKPKKKEMATICTKCGARMFPVKNEDGLKILGCPKCRYSKIVNEFKEIKL